MARLNGILTKLQGSVGSFTFKQHGSIKSIKINGKGNQAVTDISLGDLAITDETTVKEFC